MAQANLDVDVVLAWRLVLAELLRLAQALHEAHLARSETEQAACLAGDARSVLEEARARLDSIETVRDEFSALAGAAEADVQEVDERGVGASGIGGGMAGHGPRTT